MFKIKIVTIFPALFLFTILFTILSGCSGGGGGNSAPSKDNPIKPVVINPGVYIDVPANDDLGVPAFRVMKYEAKRDTSAEGIGKAVSKEDGEPWEGVRRHDAIERCKLLNSEASDDDINNDVNKDGTYALISNSEWMSLARDIENVPANWTSGIVGTGCLFRGNVGAKLPCEGSADSEEDVDSGYNHGSPDYGPDRSSTAKLTLSNGEEIWDLSGNLLERTDYLVPREKRAYVSVDGSSKEEWRDFKDLDTNIEEDSKMPPASWAPSNLKHPDDPNLDLDGSHGIGRYWGGNNDHDPFRGGAFHTLENTGIFTLMFSGHGASSGFRCVYRPKSESGSESQ